MKVTVVCEVKDKADHELKLKCIKEQTCQEMNAIYVYEKNNNWNETINSINTNYTVFVGELDYISVDYIRMIVKEAEEKDSDIVSCDIAYGNPDGDGYVYSNLSPLRSKSIDYDNKKLNEMYEKYATDSADIGMVYGKCIRTDLLKETIIENVSNSLSKIYENIVERANRFTNIHGAYYFRHGFTKEDKKSYLNSITTPISKGFSEYEEMKKAITDDRYQVISFDVFDTLILRNLYEPTDLFRFLDDEYNDLFKTNAYTLFSTMRRCAEEECRKRIRKQHSEYEDINLDEIYQEIAILYKLDLNTLEVLKQKEIELEYHFCTARNTGKDLYELALYLGKKVICTSDMYLPKQIVSNILIQNGYDNVKEIFVSSETRVCKCTGKAYEKLPEWLNCKKNAVLHIGDNKESDVNKPKEKGIEAFHLPKTQELFWGIPYDGQCIKGRAGFGIYGYGGTENNYYFAITNNLGIRCMLSLVMNKFFDNPFTGYNLSTDFDADPYLIGYYAMGMHLWAVADWLTKETKNYSKIHFLSRDGYAIKQVYDIMNAGKNSIPSEYTYMSRNILPLCDISKKEDLWGMRHKVDAYASTPEKLTKMLRPGISTSSVECIKKDLKSVGIEFSQKIETEERFTNTINIISEYVDFDVIQRYKEKLRSYFESVFAPNECIVDVGYNGRVEASIKALCGIGLDSFYFHAGEDRLYERENRYSFRNRCFYTGHPVTTYIVREQFISKIDPPIKGIEFDDDSANLIFGELEMDRYSVLITQTIQDAAVEYAKDLMKVFGEYQNKLSCRRADASRPLDCLFNRGKETDVKIYACTEFEDDFGCNRRFDLSDVWNEQITGNRIDEESAVNRADYAIFKKYYLKAERFLPKNSKRRAAIRKIVKLVLRAK